MDLVCIDESSVSGRVLNPFREESAIVSHTTELDAQFKVELAASFNEEHEEIIITNQI